MNAVSRDDGVLRASILLEAARLFAEQGYSSTSMRQVVEACYCTKPALYYYFKSKEALFREVIRIEMDRTSELIQKVRSFSGSFQERLGQSVLGFFEHFLEASVSMRLLQRMEMTPEEGMPDIEFCCGQELHLNMVEELISEAIASGELRQDLDAELAAITLDGAIRIHFQLAMRGKALHKERLLEAVDMIFDGIKQR